MQPCASSSKMIVEVEPRQRRAADVLLHIDAAEPERGRLAQRLDRKRGVLVPIARVRHHLVAGEIPRGILNGALLFGEFEVHARALIARPRAVNERD